MIFDETSPFLTTSTTGNWPLRLKLRHHAIIEANSVAFIGARILDLASHDGRWSYAALHAGAAHVTGIEVRNTHVQSANAVFSQLAVPQDCFEFHCADVFERRDLFERSYDVVLCLGLLYHTARHCELFDMIRHTSAKVVIVDTAISMRPGAILELKTESSLRPGKGSFKTDSHGDQVLVAYPSRKAISLMLNHLGYTCSKFDWATLLDKEGIQGPVSPRLSSTNPVADYIRGERETITAVLSGPSLRISPEEW